MKHKKLFSLLTVLCITLSQSIAAFAFDYEYESGADTKSTFGVPTPTNTPAYNPQLENVRRDKNAAITPPAYGVFSGGSPTDLNSFARNIQTPKDNYAVSIIALYGGSLDEYSRYTSEIWSVSGVDKSYLSDFEGVFEANSRPPTETNSGIVSYNALSNTAPDALNASVIGGNGNSVLNTGQSANGNSQNNGYYSGGNSNNGYSGNGNYNNNNGNSNNGNVNNNPNNNSNGIEVLKTDAINRMPLTGAAFTVERLDGTRIGAYETDENGRIVIPGLAEGDYIITETKAPNGYIEDTEPKIVTVRQGRLTTIEVINMPKPGLRIIKLDSATGKPLEGAEFGIAALSGEKIQNTYGGYTFKTDKQGQIYVPGLEDGYYAVTETKAPNGYALDAESKVVSVSSDRTTVLEVLNAHVSGLLIIKTDAVTGRPLKGVVFDIRLADGKFVAGNMTDGNQPNTYANSMNKTTSPNGSVMGSYTTDAEGRILVNHLNAGEYMVTEQKALKGYELDTAVYGVTITPGNLVTLELTNMPKAGLRILKLDSVTKKPIYNAEFMVFDENGKVVGNYTTDNNGIIDFAGILSEGRYTIRETRPAPGYYADDIPKTVMFTAGKFTEIVWENIPKMGQIQITKVSADDNRINGLPAGTPLQGAIFEVYAYKSGNLVDRFASDTNGKAVSKPLPLGRYIVKEVHAPIYYRLNTKELDVDLEFGTQIIKLEYSNYSANTGVYIKSTGNIEAMPCDTIRYTLKALQNTSNIPLTDFFWRGSLPTDAVRLNKLITGTYSQKLQYKIMATTNKNRKIFIADNLSTTMNNVIDCSAASLNLSNDEYVTDFSFVFGNVQAGFTQEQQAQIFVDVEKGLPNGYQFSVKTDAGGRCEGVYDWVISNSTCVTEVFALK